MDVSLNITLLFQNYAISATNQKDPQGEHVCIAIDPDLESQIIAKKP